MRAGPDTFATLAIRPIRPDDRERILHAVEYTSDETYARRFHDAGHRFTESELTYLTEVDGDRHVALIATELDRPDRLVAIARFVGDALDPGQAEFAITVHDPYQRRGVGRRMLTLLAESAAEHGITHLRAMIEFDNHPMLALLHSVLPQARLVARDGRELEYEAELGSEHDD
jgi:GNAT superfamily N-acetyltransferase